jgi:methylenetetrahydrofolate reductase (NADPH)
MRVTEHLERASEPLISYEIIPPRRGGSVRGVFDIVEQVLPFEPPFIDVTGHSAEVYYEEMPDGSIRRHVKRKRPGTLGLCAAIQYRYGIDTVPHLLCHGFTREETEDALIELHYLGVHNLMALRGDEKRAPQPTAAHRSVNNGACDLVQQVRAMNEGRFLEALMDAERTDFCIGVAGYPEKHFQAPNLTWDILNLKQKVDAGADYVVTQLFYDNRHYFSFVERCREVGITVPILPGLKLLSTRRHLHSLPSTFHIEIPEALAAEVEAAKDEHIPEIGVEWATRQADELMSAGVPGVHFYIMQTAAPVVRVVDALRKLA